MLWHLPIEKLDSRYTAQWLGWYEAEFQRLGVEYTTVYPPYKAAEKISSGQFLDVVNTHIFKFLQLNEMLERVKAGHVKNGDVVFLADIWFPGLESLFYVRDALGIDFKICGYLHAGTYDPWDFLTQKGMSKWGANLEESWFAGVDAIFVHTQFNNSLLRQQRVVDATKVKIVGFPFFLNEEWEPEGKQNIVVFPHRLAPEKRPQDFLKLAATLKAEYPTWDFIRTQDEPRTKEEYYNLLRAAKVSFSAALQETWGVSTQESLLLGCIPVVPDRLAYRDLYPGHCRYSTFEQAVAMVKDAILYYDQHRNLLDRYRARAKQDNESAVEKMVKHMQHLTEGKRYG